MLLSAPYHSRCKPAQALNLLQDLNNQLPSFGSLLDELSFVASHSNSERESCSKHGNYPTLRVFVRWLDGLRKHFTPLPEGTTRSIFRLLFPEEDVRRKYGIQENRLASFLAKWIGVPDRKLQCWKAAGASGCLGLELRQMLVIRSSKVNHIRLPFLRFTASPEGTRWQLLAIHCRS